MREPKYVSSYFQTLRVIEHARQMRELRLIIEQGKKDMSKYILWTPDSNLPPKAVFESRQEAIKVSGRMAHENPGKTFYVCKLVNSAVKPLPVTVSYEDLDR